MRVDGLGGNVFLCRNIVGGDGVGGEWWEERLPFGCAGYCDYLEGRS